MFVKNYDRITDMQIDNLALLVDINIVYCILDGDADSQGTQDHPHPTVTGDSVIQLYWVFIESSTKKQTLTQDLEIGWDKLNMVEPL